MPYIILESPFWMWYCIKNGLGALDFIYYISMASFWNEHIGLWFIALIIPLYLISPIIYYFVRSKDIKFRGIICILGIIFFLTLSIVNTGANSSIFLNIQYCAKRVPCYLIGFIFAKEIFDNKEIDIRWLIGIFVCCIGYYLIVPMDNRFYMGWVYAMALAMLYTYFFDFIDKFNISNNCTCPRLIMKTFTLLGHCTLTIYILYDVAANAISELFGNGYGLYFGSISLGLFLGILYQYFSKMIKTYS